MKARVIAAAIVSASVAATIAIGRRVDRHVLPTVTDDPSVPRLDLNGTTFHAEALGDDTAHVIVVLHGGPGGDYRSLLPLADLADHHRVVFFDQRGAGLSARVPATQLTATTALSDLDAVLDHYSPDRPVTLIGHSWGAILAAGYLRHRPDRVDAAVLAEPGYLDRGEYDEWRERYDDLMSGWRYVRLLIAAGIDAQFVDGPDEHAKNDYLVGERIVPAFASHPDNPYHRPGEAYDAPSWRWGTLAGSQLTGETFTDGVDTLWDHDGPVLFLAGEHDTWMGEDLQRRHARRYPNASLAVISDAGHDMFADNPRTTTDVIRNFLSDHEVGVRSSP